MDTAIVLFTRDLRVHDNPALADACASGRRVVPLFVVDPSLTVPRNRARFLAESVAVLREELRELGGDLVIRRGDPVAEVIRLARQATAGTVFVAGDVSRYATRREQRLARECARHRIALAVTPGHAVVPAGNVRPAGGGHYRVFTPYWRAWGAATWRQARQAPRGLSLPPGIEPGDLPAQPTGCSGDLAPGGERAGRAVARGWLDEWLKRYGDERDNLAGDETSRLSAYLRFGCVSALALARDARARPGGEEFCRQLAWRDFFHQVTAAFQDIATADYRPGPQGPRDWAEDPDALGAWQAGRTGIPVVDAGMRQLAAEGFMHNRARMITASFLTRTLGIDWRHGYRHFGELLADGDVACNAGNWQWVAGTGNNPRPGRVLNPLRQAARFDPDGEYVRRYVPELASARTPDIHAPWRLPAAHRRQLRYPDPLIDVARLALVRRSHAFAAFCSFSAGITARANRRASSREKVSTSRRRAPVSSMACCRAATIWPGVPDTAIAGRFLPLAVVSTWNSPSVAGTGRRPPAVYSARNCPKAPASRSRFRSAASSVSPIATKRSSIMFAPERACPLSAATLM